MKDYYRIYDSHRHHRRREDIPQYHASGYGAGNRALSAAEVLQLYNSK